MSHLISLKNSFIWFINTLRSECYYSDHVSLQVGEGGQVKDVLDEVWWARLAQPQEHGVAVLQQEHARVCQTLL